MTTSKISDSFDSLPDDALLRVDAIVRNRKKGINGIYPISRSVWYVGIKKGIYPKPVRIGGCAAWRVGDIRALLASQNHRA